VNIEEKQLEIIEEFNSFGDLPDKQSGWMEKYEYIIELGKDLPLISDEYKTEDNLIKGCQSKVWLHAEIGTDGKVNFSADSDAIITKGLVSLVIRVLNHELPHDIAQANLHFVQDIGLTEHLSPTRSNGLASMIKQMKMYGLAFSA
jgi:cysteine desulfuration protein SufE